MSNNNIDFDKYDSSMEIDFDDDRPGMHDHDDEILVCPSCNENEVSRGQISEQLAGHICTICNFHQWEI